MTLPYLRRILYLCHIMLHPFINLNDFIYGEHWSNLKLEH